MKIGYDAKRLFCNQRGLGNYSRDLIRIMSSYYPDNIYNLYTPKIKIDVKLNEVNTFVFQPKGVYNYLPRSFWRSYGLTQVVASNKDQIFHGLSQELPIGIERKNLKTIITFHDAIFMRYPELYDDSYQRIFTLKNRRAFNIADKVIAISEQSKQDAIRFFEADEKKIEVIYQGCNNIFRVKCSDKELSEIKEKYQLPQNFMLYVGAVEPRKNIANLLESMRIKQIDFPLVVVGRETSYTKTLFEMCSQYRLTDKVHFLKNVPTPDLPALYQSASLFVYPSVFEGFGIPLLEALVSGTPVISSKGSCFEESGGPFSKYVNPIDAEEIGEAILTILGNSAVQNIMKEEGLKHASNFTDDKIAAKLMNVYSSMY